MQEALVAGENRIFRADFATRRSIQDLGGVIVACSVPGAGGVSPTGATGRITFYGTQSLAVKATKMTIALRIRTPAANNAAQTILVAKSPSALNANQWHLTIEANRILRLYVANAAGDTGQFISLNGALSVSTEYAIHAVFDGTLAVGSRAALFLSGAVAASTISGTIPAAMTPGKNATVFLTMKRVIPLPMFRAIRHFQQKKMILLLCVTNTRGGWMRG